jgi:hypothetical protein
MKLFRMAFWLGIVIYNLSSTVSKSTGPASHHASQGSVAKAATQSCLQPFESCAKTVEALNKGGESGGPHSPQHARYYNTVRTHRSYQDAPVSRPVQQIGRIVSHALVVGLGARPGHPITGRCGCIVAV